MLLTIVGLCLVMIIGGWLMYEFAPRNSRREWLGEVLSAVGIVVGAGALVALTFCTIEYSIASTADARIEMYQEENAKIEEQIATVVKQYQEYEKDIFTEVAPESAMTLVSLYPELKADSLVASQIDIYVANNEKLKELKVEKINASVLRWWIYFG